LPFCLCRHALRPEACIAPFAGRAGAAVKPGLTGRLPPQSAKQRRNNQQAAEISPQGLLFLRLPLISFDQRQGSGPAPFLLPLIHGLPAAETLKAAKQATKKALSACRPAKAAGRRG